MLVVALLVILALIVIVTAISESWFLIGFGIVMVGWAAWSIIKYVLDKK